MPELPIDLKIRVQQHLGYASPRQNVALFQIFNQNCTQFQSTQDIYGTTGITITTLLDRCDFAFRMKDPSDTAAFTQFQQILGDVNRQTRTISIKDIIDAAHEYYMQCCDSLARFMGTGVVNLQRPENQRKYAGTIGDTYMLVSPSIPDTCVSDRLYLSEEFI